MSSCSETSDQSLSGDSSDCSAISNEPAPTRSCFTVPAELSLRNKSSSYSYQSVPDLWNDKHLIHVGYDPKFELNNTKAAVNEPFDFDPESAWHVEDSLLRGVPAFFPIEKTHVVVHNLPAKTIADNISECLQKLSIAAVYDDHKAVALAETPDHVRFYIRLFKESNDDAESSGILVEIQRRTGCSVSFRRAARSIFSAARGECIKEEVNGAPLTFSPKRESPEISKSLRKEAVYSIEIAACLLKEDCLDSNLLGIEHLRCLTDTRLSHSSSSHLAAKRVLRTDGDVHDAVASLVQFWCLNCEEDDKECIIENELYGIMHNHALAVLANALELAEKSLELAALVETGKWYETTLLTVLLDELRRAAVRQHNAYEASRCLNSLMMISGKLKHIATLMGIIPLVHSLELAETRIPQQHARLASELNIVNTLLGS